MPKSPYWTQEEIDYLESLIGNYPFRQVVSRYQSMAKRMGWAYRSFNAIKIKVSRKIGCRKAIDKNFTYHVLADILGYNRHRVRDWVRTGKLEVAWVGYLTKVTTKSLKAFVQEYPELLSEADTQGLIFLFGESKADELKALPGTTTFSKKVYCKKTGIIYPSIRAAAKANYMNKATVTRRAQKGVDFEILGEGE